MQQRTTLNLNRAVLPEDQGQAYYPGHGAAASTSHPAMNVPSGSNSVLSPMSAYFDGPPSFFPGAAPAAHAAHAAHATHAAHAAPAAPAPAPAAEPASGSSALPRELTPVVPQQVCLQAGLPQAPFMPFGAQNLPVSSGVAMAPVSPGLQPMCASIPGTTGPAPSPAAIGTTAAAAATGCGGNPTLLQSRPPKKESAPKEETKRIQQGRAPCPIGVYVDLSSLRVREKK